MKSLVLYSFLLPKVTEYLLLCARIQGYNHEQDRDHSCPHSVLSGKNRQQITCNNSVGSTVKGKQRVLLEHEVRIFPLKSKDCCKQRWLTTNYVFQTVSKFSDLLFGVSAQQL